MKSFEFIYEHLLQERKSPYDWTASSIDDDNVEVSPASQQRFHDYKDYVQYVKRNAAARPDDEEDADSPSPTPAPADAAPKRGRPAKSKPAGSGGGEDGASSIVAKKAYQVSTGKFADNTVLINDEGESLIIQSFYSFPMILDGTHQLNKPFIGINILDHLVAALNTSNYSAIQSDINDVGQKNPLPSYGTNTPVIAKVTAGGTVKIEYQTPAAMHSAVEAASNAIAKAFKNKNLALAGDRYPIHWVNPDDRGGSRSFALCHWIKTPDRDYPDSGDTAALKRYSKDLVHYIFGYYDSSLRADTNEPQQIFGSFKVGMIQQIVNFYGFGANSLKRISALKPGKALNMSDEAMDGRSTFKILDNEIAGKTLNSPWSDLRSELQRAYGSHKNQNKLAKILEITDQVIGSSPEDGVSFPLDIDGISLKSCGFTPNALAVDYMEILHPFAAMKPGGVINNGIYNAAHIYLGQDTKNGRKFDLGRCKIFYPSASNAKLFDSVLINPATGGKLLISSKANEGATPSVVSLAAVYDTLLDNLSHVKNDPNLQFVIDEYQKYHKDKFAQLIKFFAALERGSSAKELATTLMPTDSEARKIAKKILAINGDEAGLRVAKDLNTWDNGEFLSFCSTALNNTNLVQINTQVDYNTKDLDPDKDETVKLNGFLATWPNKMFDSVRFVYVNSGLRFKIDIGGGPGYNIHGTRQTEPDFNRAYLRDYNGSVSRLGKRYASPSKLTSRELRVPEFDMSWTTLLKRLNEMYEKLMIDSKDDIYNAISNLQNKKYQELEPMYHAAKKFIKQHGNDPSGVTGYNTSTRDLIDKLEEIIG